MARLLEQFRAGKPAALARAVSIVENHRPGFEQILSTVHPTLGRARRIGITGPPGAGKSTLTTRLARRYRNAGLRVGIVAVDPTSPFTGGALLGDRIRMEEVALDPGVFIRSMATRGHLGGLSLATPEAVRVLDAVGYRWVVVETVGVGQVEVDIAGAADTTVVVVNPGWGDAVQANKAGLMEIADLFVVNKADRDGALLLEKDLYTLLSLEEFAADHWKPRILKSVATSGEGVSEIVEGTVAHSAWLESSPVGYSRRLRIVSQTIATLIGERITRMILTGEEEAVAELSKRCISRSLTPIEAVNQFLGTRLGRIKFENK
jgi:LAO/AO transport system kinase